MACVRCIYYSGCGLCGGDDSWLAGWLIATRDQNIVWIKLLILFWTYLWPSVLTALLIAAYYGRGRIQLLGAYFAFLAVLIAVELGHNAEMGITELPMFWLLLNGPATVLLFTFLIRPIRAVGPLVVVFLIAVAIGSQTIVTIAGANENLFRLIASAGFGIGLNALGVFAGMIVIGNACIRVAWMAFAPMVGQALRTEKT